MLCGNCLEDEAKLSREGGNSEPDNLSENTKQYVSSEPDRLRC